MNTQRLRRIMARHGVLGTLYVGAVLLLYHAWHRKRVRLWAPLVSAAIMLTVLSICIYPVRHRHRTTPAKSAPTVSVPADGPLHLALADDYEPVPFPPAKSAVSSVSDGPIFFSAQFYRWSGHYYRSEYGGERAMTLTDDGQMPHIFRLSPDGRHRQQLTFGEEMDSQPVISPDGRQVVFVHGNWSGPASVCLVGARGGRVRTLLSLNHEANLRLSWSPTGEWVAVTSAPYEGADANLILLKPGSGHSIKLTDVRENAWSPDGRLYVRDSNDHARIIRPGLPGYKPLAEAVWNADWLDEHTLVGDAPDGAGMCNRGPLELIDDAGRVLRRVPLNLAGKENEYETFEDEHQWRRLPMHPTTALLATWRQMSDGEHHGCFRVDLRTGEAALVADGSLLGIAADGSRVAIADNAWVGPYKRGGARVGPLQIISLATGRAVSLTDPLTDVSGGDWRSVQTGASGRPPITLLTAVEQGDLATAESFLTYGANPDPVEPDGTTALMIAAADGNEEMLLSLLLHGAHVNRTDRNGNTALMAAVGAGKSADHVASRKEIDIVRVLLEFGAQINGSNHEGYTALMLAAEGGRATVVDWLADHGSKVNACTRWRRTALMLAAEETCPHTVQVLLDHRANVHVKDENGESAVGLAGNKPPRHDTDRIVTEKLLEQAAGVPKSK